MVLYCWAVIWRWRKWNKCELFCLKDRPAIWQSDFYFPCFFVMESTGRCSAMKSWGYLAALIKMNLRQKDLFPRLEWKSSFILCLQQRNNGVFFFPSQAITTFETTQRKVFGYSCPTLALDQLQKADNEDHSPWARKHSMDQLNNPIFSFYSMWPI